MKSERLMDLISEIDPELIESADVRPEKKKTRVSPVIISLLAAAACVAVIVSVGYFVMLSQERARNKRSEKQGIGWNNISSDIKKSYADEPEKKVDVRVNDINQYGCQLSLIVNNEADYDKYYTYGEYVLHKQTDDGEVLITPKPAINQDVHTLLPSENNNKTVEPAAEIVPNANISNEKVTLDQDETPINIIWLYNYGQLEKGDYYITIDIYDSENGTIIKTEIPFTVE